MSATRDSSNESFFSKWIVGGATQNQVMAGVIWAGLALSHWFGWFGIGSMSDVGDYAVGTIFAGLSVFYFARALMGESTLVGESTTDESSSQGQTGSQSQVGSCEMSLGQ